VAADQRARGAARLWLTVGSGSATIWSVTMLRITSVDPVLDRPGLRSTAANLVRRALGLGMLSDRREIARLDLRLLGDIAREASAAGIGQQAALGLMDLGEPVPDLEDRVRQLDEAIVASPVPDRELRQLLRVYDDENLAGMLGVSRASLRRYASGSRSVPDDIAARIHFVALVTSDLAGSYNRYGLRRWWERPRAALDDRSPRAALGSRWDPDTPIAVAIGGLARQLVGSAGSF